jgi:AraC-like DNA-binding protein
MNRITLWIIFLMNSFFGYTQTKDFVIPDSLKHKSYEALRTRFSMSIEEPKWATVYIQAFHSKALVEKRIDRIAESYHFKAIIEKQFSKKMQYLDTCIQISKNYSFPDYPARAFIYKALLYENQFEFTKAMDYYTMALTHTQKTVNLKLEYTVKYFIALLKINLGEYVAAQQLFKECLTYYHSHKIEPDDYYLYNLHGMSEIYYRQKKWDSCTYYNRLGIAESKRYNPDMQYYFQLNASAVLLHKNENQPSIALLEQVIPYLNSEKDTANTAIAYYYMGKNYLALNEPKKGIDYLLKMDRLYQASPYFIYEERQGYDELIKYYASQRDLHKQLEFIKKTIQIDSFQNHQQELIKDQIQLKYDTPLLLKEKEKIISKLVNKTQYFQQYLIFSAILLLFVILWFTIKIGKDKIYKTKYEALTSKIAQETIIPNIKSKNKPVSDDIFEVIAYRLVQFEIEKAYRNPNITLISLAKDLNTNTTYLSRFFNQEKRISFSNYLSDLRIQDALETLKVDKTIRSYKILAISYYFGFNNMESFSKAFYHKTGIYPSFYIKELNKEEI